MIEQLEPRQLLSGGKTFTIEGGTTSTDVLEVDLKRDGIHWSINNGETHFARYPKKLREINIYAGHHNGKRTKGEHTVNVDIEHNAGARVKVWGTDHSVNHIDVEIFAKKVPVSLYGGDKSLNNLDAFVHSKGGAVTLVGGNWSTNNISFGGGTNTIIGGHHARNAFFQTVVNSAGSVRGGNDSSNIMYTPNGDWPQHYKLRNGVVVEEA